jgi:selenide, water dikinase
MGPAALAQVLRPLTFASHPDLIVGLQTSDDAAVYRLAPNLALVQTVDFFTPIVDDPWTYGAIAAANSMSDVYAMGGTVLLALNVAGFPEDLPPYVITAIFEGAAAKVAEAGAIIAGGHTVTDAEPKFGLVVTGTIHPDEVWTKAGARPGDLLFLTKAIGTGIVATALKREQATPEDVAAAVESMLTLNRTASEVARGTGGIHAVTDITGFGLLGHASEMAEKSGVALHLNATSVPVLPGVLAYAEAGHIAGGLGRNRAHFESNGGSIRFAPGVDRLLQTILFDPQTSGGLLLAVDPDRAEALRASFDAAGAPIWQIGKVADGAGIAVQP